MRDATGALISGCLIVGASKLLRWRLHKLGGHSQGDASDDAAASNVVPSGLEGRLKPEELLEWPEKVWGEGASDGEADADVDDDDDKIILPFDIFAACRWLDVSPDDAQNFGEMFEALRSSAAFYFRADKQGICDTLERYGVAEMLYDIACVESKLLSVVHESKESHPGDTPLVDAEDAKHHLTPTQREEMIILMGNLMRQLECLLHEYLSFNWHHTDAVLRSNQEVLHGDMLPVEFTPVRRHCSDASSESGASGRAPDSPQSDGDSSSAQRPLHSGSRPSGGAEVAAAKASPFSKLDASGDAGGGLGSAGSGASSSSAGTPSGQDAEPVSAGRRSGRLFENGLRRGGSASSNDSLPLAHSGGLQQQGSNGPGGLQSARSAGRERLAAMRSRDASRKQKTHQRAMKNWQRAQQAVSRKLTAEMLGTQRRFRTTYEIFADLKKSCEAQLQSGKGPKKRQPVCLFLGGGMAAGKSTVREIIGKDVFWSNVAKEAVVVEADAIKNRDVVYQQLSHSLPSSANIAAEVHEFSTAAAESMFVTAINRQQDVIFDGTMMWAPFVRQCIEMVRDHEHAYVRGPGYHRHHDGSFTEKYWEVDEASSMEPGSRVPYRVEIVGVTCDPGLAVARGIWRQVRTQRGVPIESQLRSHRLFSCHFEELAHLVDSATLYHTGSDLTSFSKMGTRPDPKVIAHRSAATRGEMLVNPASWARFCHKARINTRASCRGALFEEDGPHEEAVCRSDVQQLEPLRHAFRRAETFRAGQHDALRIPE